MNAKGHWSIDAQSPSGRSDTDCCQALGSLHFSKNDFDALIECEARLGQMVATRRAVDQPALPGAAPGVARACRLTGTTFEARPPAAENDPSSTVLANTLMLNNRSI